MAQCDVLDNASVGEVGDVMHISDDDLMALHEMSEDDATMST